MQRATLLAGLLLLVPIGCSSVDRPPRNETAETPSLTIDPERHAPGSNIGHLKIVAMDASASKVEPGGWVGNVQFAGEVTLAGMYGGHPAYPDFDALCFFPDQASARSLPRLRNDTRRSWFCFEELDRDLLAPPRATGAAIVVVEL